MNASLVRDVETVFVREVRPTLYSPFSLFFNLVQPLIFLGLFGPLLTSVPGIPGETVWQWFVPGILVMLILFSTSMTGYGLLMEMQTGSHERLLVTPMSRSALLIGRTLGTLAPLVVQAALVVAVVIPFGFELYPLGALVGLAILLVLGVGLGSLSYALAIAVKDQEWIFYSVQQTVIFPLLLLSGMMLPIEGGPEWMQVAARVNPFTYILEAERTLFAGDFTDGSIVGGLACVLVLAAVGLAIGTRSMKRASA